MSDTARPYPDVGRPYFPAQERVLYFLGRHLTERDYTDAHQYHPSHLAAHSWLLHGWGVIWGLEVELDRERQEAVILPGAAVDPWGRLLVVRRKMCKKLAELTEYDPCATPPDRDDACATREKPPPAELKTPLLLCLGHTEAEIEPCPVVLDLPRQPHDHRDPDWEPGRVYEAPKLFRAKWEMPDRCWPTDESGRRTRFFAAVPAEWPTAGDAPYWLRPPTPCGKPVVPLALIYRKDGKLAVSEAGKTFVPGPFYPHALTHIVGVNWTHGGHGPDQFPKSRKLRVWFDRPLQEAVAASAAGEDLASRPPPDPTRGPTGVNKWTFQVFYSTHRDQGQIRQAIPRRVGLHPKDPTQAVFEIQGEDCDEDLFFGKCPIHFRVVIRCDFVLDENGRAVDGDHVGGGVVSRMKEKPVLRDASRKPTKLGQGYRTGDGVEGGTFESWFTFDPEYRPDDASLEAAVDDEPDSDHGEATV